MNKIILFRGITLKLAVKTITKFFICISLLSGLDSAGVTRAGCQLGQTFFDAVAKRCRVCKCKKGYELNVNQINQLPYEGRFGALACPPYIKCLDGLYSTRMTGYRCIKCSTPCNKLKKEILKSCNGRRNNKCGICLSGYYSKHPLLPSFPCKICTQEDINRKECQKYLTPLNFSKSIWTNSSRDTKDSSVTYERTTSRPVEHDASNRETGLRQWYTTVAVAIICAVCGGTAAISTIIVKHNRKRNVGRGREAEGNFESPNPTAGRPLLPIQGKESTVVTLDVDGCPHSEELDIKKMMEDKRLQDCKYLITKLSAQIDRDPEPLFQKLKIDNKVMFQSRHHSDNNDIKEYVYTVLSRWIEIRGPDARVSDLYEAFYRCGYDTQCDIILTNMR